MENQQATSVNINSALSQIKIMNKLGTSFFIMFLVGAMLPLADLGGWSNETLSLYNFAEPTLLMILAVIGTLVYFSGISRTGGRIISFLFIACVIGAIYSQLQELAESTRGMRGDNFDLKNILRGFPVKELVSVASVLLAISFIGIFGGIFSPRYKENTQLKAAITGQNIELNESETSTNPESNNATKGEFVVKIKAFVNNLITKVINIAKYAYQIIKPLINSLLDKGTDIICKQQPQLKREQVKMVLGGILVVLIYLIVF